MSDNKPSAKDRFKNRKTKANNKPQTTTKEKPVAKVQNNEWEEEETVNRKKTVFKIEASQTEDEKKDAEAVADWDKIGESNFIQKSNAPKTVAVVESTGESEPKESKTADNISFGGRNMFGGGPPKFGGRTAPKFSTSKPSAKMDQAAFPTLGEEISQNNDKEKSSKAAPKFSGPNRFEALNSLEPTDKKPKHTSDDKPKEFTRKPREEKDEFFCNFRNTNKEIGQKEPESTKTEAPASNDDDNRPKFNFTNNKKGAMTMAKAQEEAQKKKAEVGETKVEEKPKPKFEQKRAFDDKRKPKEQTNGGFERSDKVRKELPKGKKPSAKPKKEIKPAAELEDEWGKGNLEDILK